MITVNGDISGIKVNVVLGDMTTIKSDAYLVPQFDSCVSAAGVGGAIMRSGGESGMMAYSEHLEAKGGRLPFGDALVTTSGGGNSKYLLHVASVGSGQDEEFSTIQKSVYNALVMAQKRGIKTVTAPALGTGAIGSLTPAQSAKAMMSALNQFAQGGGKLDEVNLVIFGSGQAHQQFADVLQKKAYENSAPEKGQKEFDFAEWAGSMRGDISANNQYLTSKN